MMPEDRIMLSTLAIIMVIAIATVILITVFGGSVR